MRGKIFKLPLVGRFAVVGDRHGSATFVGDMGFQTNLSVKVLDKDGNEKRVKDYFGSNPLQRLWYKFLYRDGRTTLDLGSGLVTHAGVRLMTQDTAVSAGAATLNIMKNHGSGTGTTAAAALDTALQTAIGTTATAGTNTNADSSPNATVTAVGTIAYASGAAVTEWGLFNSTTLSGATMWDHKVFAAINVLTGDSIQFTYVVTVNSGG